ncbi:MAG: hypothetical protein A2W00_00975 [Candidatus Eisenbacteria bacterium RBG_16_71_46]|nr:MAG: hypothetical protein A2W00_00975 [Candidatus Eisenbacteria bacterium RBG_16_71_46]OGF23768.1 MAG: hypothetical protein A2V63_09925 [Candidatus Eisenbacteria bacterium RBG_19FT_COMBO_70_11]
MAQQTLTEKDMYLQSLEREFQTTLKVLKAYPAEQFDFKPHPKSLPARDLMWMFVVGAAITEDVVKGVIEMHEMPKPPKTLRELIEAYQAMHAKRLQLVKGLSDAQYNTLIKMPAGKDKVMDLRRADALWFFAMDAIHHRGQLSVYLRMVGGKVPSIYGPSADEPWN